MKLSRIIPFITLVISAQILSAEPLPKIGAPGTNTRRLPLILNALNYSQQPHLGLRQVGAVVMIYESELYPDVPDRHARTYPTAAGWAKYDARIAAAPPGVPVCLDLELATHPGYPWTKGEDWKKVIELFRKIAVEAKSRSGNRPIGFYGLFPIDNPIPNAALNESVHPRAEMREHNDMAAPVIAVVDLLFPCNYLSGSTYDAHSTRVMESIAGEAMRLAPGKPCYLFISPQMQNTTESKYPDLAAEAASAYFGDALRIFAPIGGTILWGGYDIGVPPREKDGNIQLHWPGFDVPWFTALKGAASRHENDRLSKP